jgi:dTDP-4-amino-4,6-dideoxygalactose transaminase
LAEFVPYLEKIWESRWLTNGGAYHAELEARLAEYLGVNHLALFANGTIALVTALKVLDIGGEVITTPYSFVATAHSLVWNNLTPVFVDIDPLTCNLDPARIEAAITPRTTAILAVHCYGTPCDVQRISEIADARGLKVIYDAAHAFGVRYRGESLLRHGDLSVLSFHATKVFNTFEGGGIVSPDSKSKLLIDYLKNFGFADEVTIMAVGINGKMNEIQAAMGLLQLEYVDEAIRRRSEIDAVYRANLNDVPGLRYLEIDRYTEHNYSYFPVFVEEAYGMARDELYNHLRDLGIFGRRYFYPLISDMPMYRDSASAAHANLPCAQRIARQVICLPIYPDLGEDDAMRVVNAIKGKAPLGGQSRAASLGLS